jgi:Shedu protein SduA, C-terminal
MLMFTRHIEELAWRGCRNFGADTLAEALTDWENSDTNEAEDYWQTFLQDRPYLISLISPGPVAVHAGKAFLGGKKVDNTGGKIVDFLLEHSIGGNAALLEIKRPATKLLKETAYRGSDIYAPSTDLAGSVSQILNYRDTLMTGNISPLHVVMPSCMVLIGNYGSELDSPEKRRSLELFRSSLNGVVSLRRCKRVRT